MRKSDRRKSRAANSEDHASMESGVNDKEAPDIMDVDDGENVKMARKILKRRLCGLDVPSKYWLNFGLENQKRYKEASSDRKIISSLNEVLRSLKIRPILSIPLLVGKFPFTHNYETLSNSLARSFNKKLSNVRKMIYC